MESRWATTAACSSATRASSLATKSIPSRAPRRPARFPRPSRARDDHYQEWIRACKGGKPAGSNFDWAGPLAESVLLGNVALRVQLREDLTLCKLLWDSATLKFTNLDEANQFLRRDYRPGWKC